MELVELIALLALLQFLAFGVLTGRARGAAGIKAPAISGDEGFERMYRVQMNTIEMLIAFLPALFLAAKYWPAPLIAVLGLAYLIGRLMYWRAYVSDPSTRGLGFMISFAPVAILILIGIIGAVLTLLGLKG
ncbi:MAPEG family protein [Tateyamaria sp.]|uniref:MAPEG family protein n=1 Tax=Tateyamaria sp. TaxID=1929288 RepID=UPI00329D7C1C